MPFATTRAANSTSTNLVKTSEITSSLPRSSTTNVSRTKIQSRPSSGNFEEQRTESNQHTITSLQQQNETVVNHKLTRPKSFLNKNTKKNTATVSDRDSHLKKTDSYGVFSIKNAQKDSKGGVWDTTIELKQKTKQKPPPVLPKPKRNKGEC